MNRFERQEILKGFGIEGQKKLREARILVVGAGGLGCPALLYLAAAGIGTLGIADGDFVSLSNLNRQILFGIEDLGKPKASTAAGLLNLKYPDIHINIHETYLQVHNAIPILSNYDLIIDGTDNFQTRYLLNDGCFLLKKPYIMAAIFQNEGQVAVLNLAYGNDRPLHYRDIYPDPPMPHEIPNCNESGVIGVLPGILGMLQAAEAIKLLTGYGTPLKNKLLHYHLLDTNFFEIEITANPKADQTTPLNLDAYYKMDYVMTCGGVETINWKDAMDVLQKEKHALLIDVREKDELPTTELLNCHQIPLRQLENEIIKLQAADSFILFCQTGTRSGHAASLLKAMFPNKHIYSIIGGLRDFNSPLNLKLYG
ncbi:MAG: HesA/MoeB/ThiF family protein [Saprospiraceae bacterium]|nr:HesA/MoeB/ThiF family protein [Saprospiraceae bacterium]